MISNIMTKYNIKENYVNLVDIILCICLFVMAIYKGSFYKQDIIFPNLVVTIIGVGYVLIRLFKELISKKRKVKKEKPIYNILGLLFIALPIAYALPIVFKTYSSLSNSIYEMLRYVNFCIIYYIVKKSNIQNLYTKSIIGISVMLTILGLDQVSFRNFEQALNNLSTGYLSSQSDRLSATIQYANITGVIILLGYIFICMYIEKIIARCIKNSNNDLNQGKLNKITEKTLLSIYSSFLTIQTIAIILTSSRLAIFLLVISNVVLITFNMCSKRKTTALLTVFIFISGIMFSGAIILSKVKGNYKLMAIYIIIASIFSIIIAHLLTVKKTRGFLIKIKNKIFEIFKYKKQKLLAVFVLCFLILLTLALFSFGKPFRIALYSKSDENIIKISKNLYGFKEGKNNLVINIKPNEVDSRYTINIIGVKPNLKEELLETIKYDGKAETKYVKEITVEKEIENIVLSLKLTKGDITFQKVELNNKKQKLSYLLLPETIVSKFKQINNGKYNNKIRSIYIIDSIKIWKQSKIVGFGGEGFKYNYQNVQTTNYVSTEAHSCLLQTLVEAGIIGLFVLMTIILISVYMSIYLIVKGKKHENIYFVIALFSILTICIFDLAMSFGIMIYLLAIFIAIVAKKYSEINRNKENHFNQYFKIAALSFALVCLFPAIYFSTNIYRASLIKTEPKAGETSSEEYINEIAALSKKASLDKYDIGYKSALITKHSEYKRRLASAYYTNEFDYQRKNIKEEIINSTINIKENADFIIDNEYSDKYVLELVANIYFTNFADFANIYEAQFKDKELAYAFYLGYALKLTDRINEIAPYSEKSNNISHKIYSDYFEQLTIQNNILQSQSIANICALLELRLNKIN